MIQKNQGILNFLNMAPDAFLIFISYSLAVLFRLKVLGGHTGLGLLGLRCQLLSAGCAILVVFLCCFLQMYASYRFKTNVSEALKIFLVNGVVSLSFMALLYLIRVSDFPRLAIAIFWLISSLFVILKRTLAWDILRYCRRLGYNQKAGHYTGCRNWGGTKQSQPDFFSKNELEKTRSPLQC